MVEYKEILIKEYAMAFLEEVDELLMFLVVMASAVLVMVLIKKFAVKEKVIQTIQKL